MTGAAGILGQAATRQAPRRWMEHILSSFTPWSALAGGLLIGLAAVLLLAGIGRLAGISNIALSAVDGIFRPPAPLEERSWRWVFLFGLVLGSWGFFRLTGRVPNPRTHVSPALMALAGLLVGYGTSLSNGCTSGHGVCGLGRMSLRSLAATLIFMASGAATVFVVRHVLSLG